MSHMTNVTEEIEIRSWSEFESEILKIEEWKASRCGPDRIREMVFRGLGNADWGLETTLDRSLMNGERADGTMSLLKYYKKIDRAKTAIESVTGRQWRDLPDWHNFRESMAQDPIGWLDMILTKTPEVYEYLVYLRHHGFPSPLLDWTESPYLATFFAYDGMEPKAKHVCVYALLQSNMTGGSSDAHFFIVGPYMNTHPRHYLQQGRYSMCVSLKIKRDEPDNRDFLFCPQTHGILEGGLGKNGRLLKIKLPATERLSILQRLDQMNINPHSLYGSEDALVRTIARRECLFKDWD